MRTRERVCAFALVGSFVLLGTSAVNAEDASTVQRGNLKFQLTCAPCHGAGPGSDGRPVLPGTAALQLKYKGALPALLEARTDLTVAALKTYVRRGSWSMPPFRPTELTDAEIRDIAAYLATAPKATAKASPRQ
jgi:mono/diheme cytochrome c family protein